VKSSFFPKELTLLKGDFGEGGIFVDCFPLPEEELDDERNFFSSTSSEKKLEHNFRETSSSNDSYSFIDLYPFKNLLGWSEDDPERTKLKMS
jgi:hypothetical protein